jgi:hypothetical protein
VRDERVDVDVAGEVALDELRHLVAALDAAERRAATRRPVIRKRGTMSSVSPLPATPATVHRPQPMRADSTAWRITRRCRSPRRCSRRRSRRSSRGSRSTVSVAADERVGRALAARELEPSSERSTQTIRSAPCSRQPATAPRPTMPAPKTTHVEPARPSRCSSPRRGRSRARRRTGRRGRAAPRVDLRERDLRHHRVLGERRRAHEVADRLAVARQARRAVGQVALVLLLADREAEVRARRAAVDALAALRREQRDDVVAGRDDVTPSPTRSTTPAPSWPSTVGA